MSKKEGHLFPINCVDCPWSLNFSTSKVIEQKEVQVGRKMKEVNIQTVLAFREIGHGYTGIQSFCRILNMPPPMTKTNFYNLNSKLHLAYLKTSRQCMKEASEEIRRGELGNNYHESTVVTTVSLEGSWQRRGYSSMNGIVTAMSHGKCIDAEVLSKSCYQCKIWERKKDSPGYEEWKANHDCKINHIGSSGSMESAGVIKIFKRSVNDLQLKYLTYIGDGDTKSYSEESNANPYPGETIVKAECIGHVQKRVGSRLRALRDRYKGRKLSDGKSINGRGRLTDKCMNSLQNYYGMAIRQNVGDLYGMKKAVAAVLFHCVESDNPEQQHQFCPRGPESWCKCHSNKESYKQKIKIPKSIMELLKPIFSHTYLGNEELLKKCLHGQTQNVNESINGLVWARAPKRVYVERLLKWL